MADSTSTDAWSYALERSKAYFAAPAERDAPNLFVADATRLGVVTRAMHEALAGDDGDDDEAEPVELASHEDLDRWAHRAQLAVREGLLLLERQLASNTFPKARVAEAQALVGRAAHYSGWIDEIDDQLDDDLGVSIYVHGDYKLERVTRTSENDFAVASVAVETSDSVDQQLEETAPLRDVASMLRSFGYAAATLAQGVEKTIDAQTREIRSARWERDVRAAFLAGYLGKAEEHDDEPGVLPENEENIRKLILLFETEKAFTQLADELNNRPELAWIPMRGISKLATAEARRD
jgi:maltose alpha-D-glucosyltransferase / alpha-amylase